MEIEILDSSFGLMLWQISVIGFIIFFIYIIMKLYKKIVTYLDLKIEYYKNNKK